MGTGARAVFARRPLSFSCVDMETQAAIALGFSVPAIVIAVGMAIYLIATSDTCRGRRIVMLPAGLQRPRVGIPQMPSSI